jgi:hypothetical protein
MLLCESCLCSAVSSYCASGFRNTVSTVPVCRWSSRYSCKPGTERRLVCGQTSLPLKHTCSQSNLNETHCLGTIYGQCMKARVFWTTCRSCSCLCRICKLVRKLSRLQQGIRVVRSRLETLRFLKETRTARSGSCSRQHGFESTRPLLAGLDTAKHLQVPWPPFRSSLF